MVNAPINQPHRTGIFRRAVTGRILPRGLKVRPLMDLIAVDIDGTLASNRDQMDKYLSGFFTSYRRFSSAAFSSPSATPP